MQAILPALLEKGHVVRPWIGIQGHLVIPPLKELLRLPLTDGLLIEVVEPGNPAEQAGIHGGQLDVVLGGVALLLGGDIITHINDTPVDTPDRLTGAMRSLHVGDTLRMTLFRRGQTQEVTLILPERPILPHAVLTERSVAPLGGPRVVGRPGYRF